MSIYERLQRIDRWVLYTLFVLITVIPMIWPIPTPIRISPSTMDIYRAVDSLKAGDVVVLSIEYSAADSGELSPPLVAILEHLYKKPGVRILGMSFTPEGMMVATDEIVTRSKAAGRKYGEDVVNMGYVPGGESTLVAFAGDIHKTCPADYLGTKVETIPMMRTIRSIKDVSLVVQFTGGGLGPLGWVRQVAIPHNTKVASVVSASMLAAAVPYYQAKQLVGLGAGVMAGAEYELLVGKFARATSAMGAESFLHVYIIVLMALANIGYFGQKTLAQKARKEGATK